MKCTYSLKLSSDTLFKKCVEDYVNYTTPTFRLGAQKISDNEYDVYLAKNDVRAILEDTVVTFSVRYESYLSETDSNIKAFSECVDYCELITRQL